jgi:hypothetical protein
MKHLNKSGDNLGGLLKIWAVPVSDFFLTGSNLLFISQANIWLLYCSPDSMAFTEESEITSAGNHYNTEISGFIPQDNAALQEALEYIVPRKWVVIFMDGNGNYKLAGNVTDPLRFTYKISTGQDTASLAGCQFSFAGKTKTHSMFVNNPF